MDLELIKKEIEQKAAVALYFSAPTCNVCHALKPKLFSALEQNFKELEIISIDVSEDQAIAAHYSVFAIPTLLVFLDGREFLRKSRHMSVDEVIGEIARPYEIMFS
ncbi:Thioredoxin [hydrothermal vent metagenome]|uniref:Thioredoxin n=1 Tax=hydrothermal vent metagenome TaxID=652676 RepID=A0A1W1B8J2_9ZZZZ